MKKKIIKTFLVAALIFLNNCGFKVVDLSTSNNFTIKNIISTGDKKINYKLKNKLKFNSKNQASKILLVGLLVFLLNLLIFLSKNHQLLL